MVRRPAWILVLSACAIGEVEPTPDTTVARVQFAFPIAEPELIDGLVGVDHDPEIQESGPWSLVCVDYLDRPFPHCYDEHDGSDFILAGGFPVMDAGSATIIAAADGVVKFTRDGQYDRCFGTFDGVDCDGHPKVANAVTLEHADGSLSRYWHMKKDSVAVAVGDQVVRGQTLGLVGSSGISSLPHLHFEVEDADGFVVDPYVPPGEEGSWWCDQGHPDGLPGPCDAP